MPKISIITTTYKHQEFIKYTIESVLSQTFSDWEMLIGDDHSPDNTYDVALEYANKDPRIKVWKHTLNKGLVDNMNFLISKVNEQSDYIAFLEGDDMYTKDNLKEKITIFENYKDIVLIDTNYEKIDKNGIVIPQNKKSLLGKIKYKNFKKKGLNKMSLFELLKSGNIFQSFGTIIIKKKILLEFYPLVNLDENNKMFGPLDYFLCLNLLPNRSFYYIDKKLFLYRIHNNNFIKNITLMNHQIELIYNFIKLHTKDKNILKICNFYIENNKMVSAFFQGKYISSISHGFKSFFYNKTLMFFQRIGIIILSILPMFIKKKIINGYKNI